MRQYTEHSEELETEVGHLEVIHMTEDRITRTEVWLNHSPIHVPDSWLKLEIGAMAPKVEGLVKAAAKSGVRIGGEREKR